MCLFFLTHTNQMQSLSKYNLPKILVGRKLVPTTGFTATAPLLCSTLTPDQTLPPTYLATLRTFHRPALYPCQAAQSVHLLHLADFHACLLYTSDAADD